MSAAEAIALDDELRADGDPVQLRPRARRRHVDRSWERRREALKKRQRPARGAGPASSAASRAGTAPPPRRAPSPRRRSDAAPYRRLRIPLRVRRRRVGRAAEQRGARMHGSSDGPQRRRARDRAQGPHLGVSWCRAPTDGHETRLRRRRPRRARPTPRRGRAARCDRREPPRAALVSSGSGGQRGKWTGARAPPGASARCSDSAVTAQADHFKRPPRARARLLVGAAVLAALRRVIAGAGASAESRGLVRAGRAAIGPRGAWLCRGDGAWLGAPPHTPQTR